MIQKHLTPSLVAFSPPIEARTLELEMSVVAGMKRAPGRPAQEHDAADVPNAKERGSAS